jgi:starvation-inducible DNA-binding protein
MPSENVLEELSHLLADCTDMYLRYVGYHWNVGGPLFYELHSLFRDHATEMFQSLAPLAERIRTLGAEVPYGFDRLTALRTLSPEDTSPATVREMLERLETHHRQISGRLRSVAQAANSQGDLGTATLLGDLSRIHERMDWVLRETLSGRAPGLEHRLSRA